MAAIALLRLHLMAMTQRVERETTVKTQSVLALNVQISEF